jgi:probable HAF family extracellular repeat protein
MQYHGRAVIYFFLCSLIPSSGRSNEFMPLGFLPSSNGFVASYAYGVDAIGQAVVGKTTANGQSVAFIWHQSTGIQPLAASDGAITANAISDDGLNVVGRARTPQVPNGESYVWSASEGFMLIGSVLQTPAGSAAEDVSADGTAVVGWSINAASAFEAYRWTSQSGLVPLGDLDGGNYESVAQAVSADGRIVVGQSNSGNGTEAFRWTLNTGMVGIGDLPGGDFHSIALDTSTDGQVIVGSGASNAGFEEAFRWDATSGMVGLGFLEGGYARSSALGVSHDGTAVVGYSGLTQDDLRAFVWDETHGMRPLQQILENDPNLTGKITGWQLAMAYDISANGQAIVGWGYNPDGNAEAWLIRFDSPIGVPEPNTTVQLAIALALLTRVFGRAQPQRPQLCAG